MRNGIILSAVMAALCASGETVKTATQPWVRSYVATNRTDISGKADKTNTYTKAETDAKIVELAPPTSLGPATNYTDAALGAFAATGTVARANVYGTPTRWTDATGCVWEVVSYWDLSPANYTGGSEWLAGKPVYLVATHVSGEWWRPACEGTFIGIGKGDEFSMSIGWSEDEAYINISASFATVTNLVGCVALTNDIPDVPPETDPTVPNWAKAPSKPTYTASEVGATDGEAVTNIVRQMSLGGIYDDKLGVWWTPHMSGGAYYWTATTNVNLAAEGNE